MPRLVFWCLLLLLTACQTQHQHPLPSSQPIPLIIDADSANEIDDLYAIVRILHEPRVQLLGLSSAQWFHRLSPPNSVAASQRLNEDLLRISGQLYIPHPLGSNQAMGMPWGGYEARDSPAAQHIIRTARQYSPEQKLTLIAIGAATNIASAIALAPDIIDRIQVYVLGFHYQAKQGFWNKDEFNIRRDLNAANYLLNTEGLELHVMPANVAKSYTFQQDSTFQRLHKKGPLGQYLLTAWQERFPNFNTWVMWDVLLLEAILHPAYAKQQLVTTPPENTQRKVWVYTEVDLSFYQQDYWDSW